MSFENFLECLSPLKANPTQSLKDNCSKMPNKLCQIDMHLFFYLEIKNNDET